MKKGESLLRNVTEQLNRHEYTDLTKFLDGIDWFSIPHEQIVPREKVRAFVKSIENGLATRVCFAQLPDTSFTEIPVFAPYSEGEKAEIIRWRAPLRFFLFSLAYIIFLL